MEKEIAVREWCIDKAIQIKGGVWNTEVIIASAKQLEAYVCNEEPKATGPRRFSLVVHSDGHISVED